MSGRSDKPAAESGSGGPELDRKQAYLEELRATELLQLSPVDWWTIGSAIEGTQIFGATGSGKTSGSGRMIRKVFLEAGFGGLVLTSKSDDVDDWKAALADADRQADAVVVTPGGPHRLDFVEYEYLRAGRGRGLTQNVVSLIVNSLGSGRTGGDPYWEQAAAQLLLHAVELVAIANGTVSLPDLARVVASAPRSMRDIASSKWQGESECFQLLLRAEKNVRDQPARAADLAETARYWLSEFASLSTKTSGSIVSMFTSKADGLLRSPLRQLFCAGSSIKPADLQGTKVVILDIPVKDYGDVGRFAQVLFKTVWQRTIERRKVTVGTLPVFLWADESQYFVSKDDALFQQTARRSLAATVYLTQNLPNYFAAMGGQHAAESLVGNLQTKIFHANGDPTTNDWAERLFARDWERKRTTTMQEDGKTSVGSSEQIAAGVQAKTFTMLAKGGRSSKYRVSAIVFEGGRTWGATNDNYIRASFRQRV